MVTGRWDDTMDEGSEYKTVAEYLEKDRFAALCGITVLEVRKGYAKVRMEAGEKHLNSWGSVHGGAIFTLADMAFAAAANSHGTLSVGVSCTITYTKAAPKGTLIAVAEEDTRSARLGTYAIQIFTGDGTKVATLQGIAYNKRAPLIVPKE